MSRRFDAYFDTYDDGTNRASCQCSIRTSGHPRTNPDRFSLCTVNNITYVSPKVPSIITALSMPAEDSYLTANAGESNASFSKIYGWQTQAVTFEYMDNIEYTIYNWDAGFHPFHVRFLHLSSCNASGARADRA